MDGLHQLKRFSVLHHDLGGAVEVSEDDEGQFAAHLSDILHPTHQLDLLSHMLHAELIAGMGTGLHHLFSLLFVIFYHYNYNLD